MRFLVLALMIVLLPLRGWAGEVMATEMASSQISHQHEQLDDAIELVAGHAHKQSVSATFEGQKTAFEVQKPPFEAKGTQSASMHDCEGHAKADEAAPADGHCDSCSACQACHTVALSTAAVSLSLTFSPRALRLPSLPVLLQHSAKNHRSPRSKAPTGPVLFEYLLALATAVKAVGEVHAMPYTATITPAFASGDFCEHPSFFQCASQARQLRCSACIDSNTLGQCRPRTARSNASS